MFLTDKPFIKTTRQILDSLSSWFLSLLHWYILLNALVTLKKNDKTDFNLTLHSCLRVPTAYQEQSLCGGFCGYHHGTC